MSRTQQWLVFVVVTLALTGAALIGRLSAPDPRLRDYRRSTLLSGPSGAQALAATLSRLGIPVERRRHSFVGMDTLVPSRHQPLLAILDPAFPTGPSERQALMAAREHGQDLFVAGRTLQGCFGFRTRFAWDSTRHVWEDSIAESVVFSVLVADEKTARRRETTSCRPTYPVRVDTLLMTAHGRLLAARLNFRKGGHVTLLADSELLSNRKLKEDDILAELVVPLFFSDSTFAVSFDEYHQGFGEGGSLWRAALGWVWAKPGGWVLLQLLAAGLVGLALMSVRFGPKSTLTEHRRRSPLEHVEALASGLERAGAVAVARQRLVGGLRRRLASRGVRGAGDLDGWLRDMTTAAPAETSAALRRITTSNLRDAAIAVEDAWEAMETPETRPRS